jgi:hypothetical protein
VRTHVGEPGAHEVEGAAGGDVVDEEAAWDCSISMRVLEKKESGTAKIVGREREESNTHHHAAII